MMGDIEYAFEILAFEEGYKRRPYIDTEGYPTIGYGLKIGYKDQPIEDFKGFPCMPKPIAKAWMEHIVEDKVTDLHDFNNIYSAWHRGDHDRNSILLSMGYQLGPRGLSNFVKFLGAMEAREYDRAAEEMLDSLWARQTPNRANRHADVIRTGSVELVYGAFRGV